GGAGATAWRIRIVDAAEHADIVGAVGEGAPVLGAGDDPVVAVAARPTLDAGEVRAGARIGQGRRAQVAALGHGLDLGPSRLALARHRAVEAVAAGDDAGEPNPAARQLLGDQAVFVRAKTQPAVLLRDQDAEKAQIA